MDAEKKRKEVKENVLGEFGKSVDWEVSRCESIKRVVRGWGAEPPKFHACRCELTLGAAIIYTFLPSHFCTLLISHRPRAKKKPAEKPGPEETGSLLPVQGSRPFHHPACKYQHLEYHHSSTHGLRAPPNQRLTSPLPSGPAGPVLPLKYVKHHNSRMGHYGGVSVFPLGTLFRQIHPSVTKTLGARATSTYIPWVGELKPVRAAGQVFIRKQLFQGTIKRLGLSGRSLAWDS